MNSKTLVSIAILGVLGSAAAPALADGSGTGSGSWIGYVAGGHQASGTNSAVTAGSSNVASGFGAFVGAGTANQANGTSSLVIGGFDNRAVAIDSLVGAGAGNRATGARSVIVGGGYNLASGGFTFIGGGGRDGINSTVAGTDAKDHIAAAKWGTVGGGVGNRAGNSGAQTGATVAGGDTNQALNTNATVGGGVANVASGLAATVAGGANNLASGDYSVALGYRAKTQTSGAIVHPGAFVFADSSNFDFYTAAANEFAVRAGGGSRIVTAVNGAGTPTAGVTLAAGGGAWAPLSDRAAKQDLAVVDPQTVLAKVVAMPVSTWRYRTEVSGALHMGPTAQDFHAAFGLGDSDKSITTVDADGVALAAIQGLHQVLAQRQAESELHARELAELAARVGALETVAADVADIKSTVARLLEQRRERMVTATLRP